MKAQKTSSAGGKIWERSASEGIYLHLPSGVYYARYRLNDIRTFKSLETDKLSVAKLKRSAIMVEIETSRLRGSSTRNPSGPKTLGDLAALLVDQLTTSRQSEATKKNYRQQLQTLRACWPGGAFDGTLPSSVTYDTLTKLRESLKVARWKGHLQRRAGKGYSNAYTNQILSRLNNLLTLARSHNLCGHDPFKEKLGLQGDIFLPLNHKAPRLPSTGDMDRIFAEITKLFQGEKEHSALFEWRRVRAFGASEHARFIAFSGCRLEEANRATFEDDRGTVFHVNGTKSAPADRDIPCVKAFRALLDEIRQRRTESNLPLTGRILTVSTSRDALKHACARLGLKKLGHHHLRHYFATVCIESGVDIPTVSRWLGHSDGGVLAMRVYGHLRIEHSLAQAAKVTF